MLGKMSGGWIARRWGIVTSFALMVVVAALCFYIVTGWHGASPYTGMALAVLLVGAFAVNCTMPVTLYLANAVLPGREGLAFGLLAAALIPGYLLATL
jgi:predicted MFS family arabinose efflux permease